MTPSQLRAALKQVQENFDFFCRQFPVSPSNLSNAAAGAGAWVDSLPTKNLFTGRTIVFRVAERIYWHLFYTGEETFPWAKIGGPPLFAERTNEESTASTTFTTLNSPAITVPLAGDYFIDLGCRYWNSTAAAYGYFAPKIGAAATADDDGVRDIGASSIGVGGMRRKPKTNIAISTVIQAQVRVAGGTGFFNSRWMTIDPQRVG